MSNQTKQYNFIRNKPVARFFYQGESHTHPIRRTIVIIEQNDTIITGYELREGSITREFKNAPIKSYRKDKIAKIKNIDRRRVLRRTAENLYRSTLVRSTLGDLVKTGA